MADKTPDATQQAVNELEAFFARQELATAPAWQPQISESLFGTIIDIEIMQPRDPKLKAYPKFLVKTDHGVRAVHAFHTMLQDGLREVGANIGTRVGITYKGINVKLEAVDKEEDERDPTDTYHFYFVADLDKVTAPEVKAPVVY